MTTLIDEDLFQGGLGAYALTGSPTVDSNGLLIDTTGGAAKQYAQFTMPGSTFIFVFRKILILEQAPAANNNFFNMLGAGCKLILLTSGALRAQVNAGTTQTSSALTIGQRYLVEARFDSSGATTTIDWSIDGVAQTQASTVQASTALTFYRFGIQGATTVKAHMQAVKATDQSGDYKLGMPLPETLPYQYASAGYYGA